MDGIVGDDDIVNPGVASVGVGIAIAVAFAFDFDFDFEFDLDIDDDNNILGGVMSSIGGP